MTSFSGQSGDLLLFTNGDRGVVVDSELNLVVETGRADALSITRVWHAAPEPTGPAVELANGALTSLDIAITASAGRKYTIPKGVQAEAKKALQWHQDHGRGGTQVALSTAKLLASGGQIDIQKIRHVANYFPRHQNVASVGGWKPAEASFPSDERITWGMWGGDAARKWTLSIVEQENSKALTADGYATSGYADLDPSPVSYDADVDAFRDALELDPTNGPEFLARVRMDGSGIDRLYKVDLDSEVYVWDDGGWTNLGTTDQDIWSIDRALDQDDPVDKTHVVIDPDSAIIISARFQVDPFTPVSIEDIDAEEARLTADAIDGIDWEIVESALTAAGDEFDPTPGEYDPQERAENASKQVRDKAGKFATVGSRVMVGGNPSTVGNITRVNPADGTVSVLLESGGSVTVPGKSVEGVGQFTTTIPGEPVEVPDVDLTGILAEPRTPINRVGAQIPGTLPKMTGDDLHKLLYDWPAWVKGQRDGFKEHVPVPKSIKVGPRDSTDVGDVGRQLERQAGQKLSTNAYDHPLLQDWLKRRNKSSGLSNGMWYNPMTAAGAKTSDVEPLYMAIVDEDDPRAVLHLVSLVPAGTNSTAPMTYTREDGKWERNPQILNDLNSATPPPVVPLDSETLNDVLKQVDSLGDGEAPEPEAASESNPVAASGISLDHALMVLYGPRTALVAAGGLDRNRGGAEKLRRYWLRGPGAAKIRWGTPGDWRRCVRHLGKYMGERAKGYCQLRHKEADGFYTGDERNTSIVEFQATEVTDEDMNTPLEEIEAEHDALFDSEFEPDPSIVELLSSGDDTILAAGGLDRNRGNAEKLRRYWTRGIGGAKIRWGTGGDWTRCVRQLSKYMGTRAKGYCALRHKEMTGMWAGDKRNLQTLGRRNGVLVNSTDVLNPTATIISSALLRAKANNARNRLKGLTAAAMNAEEVTPGARFVIPLVIPEETETGDGRWFEQGAIDIRDLPLPLMWQEKTADGHDGSYVVGRIDHMERVDHGIGNAYGFFDTGEFGHEAERLVREGFFRGVSADMDNFEAQQEEVLAEDEKDENGDPKKKERIVVSKARVMGVTIVAKPAFQECKIFLEEEGQSQEDDVISDGIYVDDVDPFEAASLVAAGYVAGAIPVTPPSAWFLNPRLNKITPITVEDDGRVFGHIASWDMDHIGLQFGTRPPHSRSNYAYFHTGILRTEEGEDVPVGQLTLAGGHASLEASAAEAVRHYDDTASAVADVQAGEDAHGIWVSGALRPGVTPEQIRTLRASAPSGDWRPIKGRLELVAVCQVNVPGFPVTRARVASGQVLALVAAGAQTLAKMRHDPIAELNARIERLESAGEPVVPVMKVEGVNAAELAAQVKRRMEQLGYVSKADREKAALTASIESLRARVAAGRPKKDPLLEDGGADPKALTPEGVPVPVPNQGEESEIVRDKYTPKTQPRDGAGKFRTVLARLRDNLGENGNQKVLEQLEETENLDSAGDYIAASRAAGNLIGTIDRLDSGALNAVSLNNVRVATTDLGKVIANLPLPFENQAQKVRFSDLPPALRKLTLDMIKRVEEKLDPKEAAVATQELQSFMSGSDVFSQSEISAQLNRMLRLLT